MDKLDFEYGLKIGDGIFAMNEDYVFYGKVIHFDLTTGDIEFIDHLNNKQKFHYESVEFNYMSGFPVRQKTVQPLFDNLK